MIIRRTNRSHGLLSAAISALFLGGALCGAQTQAQQEEDLPGASSSRTLEEVVVTGRRREESLQEIPMSVQAFTAEDLELSNIETGRDYHHLVPNFVMAGGGGDAQGQAELRIRGMPGVGIYLDGIWQGDRGALQAGMLEMQRVEVLRGPQGTLFGRNTNGGAVQYVSALPAQEFGARGEFTVGNLNRRDLQVTLDVPVSEQLLTRLTVAGMNRDGYLRVIGPRANDRKVGGRDDQLLRGDVLWQATDDLSLRSTAFNGRQRSENTNQIRIAEPGHAHNRALNILMQMPDSGISWPAPAFDEHNFVAGHPGGVVGQWETRSNVPRGSLSFDSQDYTATVSWDVLENLRVTSLSGLRYVQDKSMRNTEAGDMYVWGIRYWNRQDSRISQELHLSGPMATLGHDFDYLIGGYYSDNETKSRTYQWLHMNWYEPAIDARGYEIPVVNQRLLDYVRNWGIENDDPTLANYSPNRGFVPGQHNRWSRSSTQDMALFGELTWYPVERFEASLGLRWSTRDTKSQTYEAGPNDAAWNFHGPTVGGGFGDGNMYGGEMLSENVQPNLGWHFTPRLSMSYSWNSNVITYMSYAEGYSAGSISFNENIQEWVELVPEVVEAYEFGLRSDWFEGAVRFNASYFRNSWEGMRVTRHPPDPANPGGTLPFPYTVSDGIARAQGVETATTWYATDSLRFRVNMGWLETEYKDWGDPSLSTIGPGIPMAYAPEWSYSLEAQYDVGLPNGARVTFRTDYGWMSKYERDSAGTRQQSQLEGGRQEPAYGLLGARIRYVDSSDRWNIALHGTNLTNEHYVDSGFVSAGVGLDFLTVGPSRQFGVTMGYRF